MYTHANFPRGHQQRGQTKHCTLCMALVPASSPLIHSGKEKGDNRNLLIEISVCYVLSQKNLLSNLEVSLAQLPPSSLTSKSQQANWGRGQHTGSSHSFTTGVSDVSSSETPTQCGQWVSPCSSPHKDPPGSAEAPMLPGQASMQLPSTPTMKTWRKVSKRRAVWGRAAEERNGGLGGWASLPPLQQMPLLRRPSPVSRAQVTGTQS